MANAPRKKPEPKNYKDNADRFNQLGTIRLANTLDQIRLVGQLADPKAYDYVPAQVDAMFAAIDKAVAEAKARFANPTQKAAKAGLDLAALRK